MLVSCYWPSRSTPRQANGLDGTRIDLTVPESMSGGELSELLYCRQPKRGATLLLVKDKELSSSQTLLEQGLKDSGHTAHVYFFSGGFGFRKGRAKDRKEKARTMRTCEDRVLLGDARCYISLAS